MFMGGGGGGASSCDESPVIMGLDVGDCVALAFPRRSLEPLDRERERERRFVRAAGSGVTVSLSTSTSITSGSTSTSTSTPTSTSTSTASSALSSGGGVPSSSSSFCPFSPSLTACTCMGGRLPSFIRGNDAARLSFATANARCSAAEVSSCSITRKQSPEWGRKLEEERLSLAE